MTHAGVKCRAANTSIVRSLLWAVGLAVAAIAASAADAAETRHYRIPAQPLARALMEFSRQTDMDVAVSSDLVRGKRSQGIEGQMAPLDALKGLIRGSGLTLARGKNGSIMLIPSRRTLAGDPMDRIRPVSSDRTRGQLDVPGPLPHEPQEIVEEIVVTATKRPERLQDVSMAVTAMSARRLGNMGAENFEDIARTVPGLSVVNAGPSHNKIVIRGISSGVRVEGATTSVYFDDVPVTASSANLDLKLVDIERVEVLRGPQGTLYGESAMGGAVKYITRKPDFTRFSSRIEKSYSSTSHGADNWTANAMLNVPLVDKSLAVRLVGYYQNYSGYIDNIPLGIGNINDEETYGGRLAVRWLATDNLTLGLNIFHQRGNFGARNTFMPETGDLKQTQLLPEVLRDKFTIYNLTAHLDAGWATLDSSTSYIDRSLTETRDWTTLFVPFAPTIGRPDLAGALVSLEDFGGFQDIVQELRLSSQASGPFHYLIGSYLSQSSGGLPQDMFIHPPGQPSIALLDTLFVNNESLQIAAFGELTYDLTNQLQFTIGARWYRISENISFATTGLIGSKGKVISGRSQAEGIIPKFLLSYKVEDKLLYLQVAKGFRPGGSNVGRPIVPGVPLPGQFEPDTVWSYEFGAKTSWFDDRLIINLALFQIDWTKIQSTVEVGGTFVVGNAGKARSRGIELEMSARPITGLELGFAGSLIDAVLLEDQVAPNFGLRGEQVPAVPQRAFSAYARYQAPVGVGNWHAFIQGDYQSVGQSKNSFTNLAFGIVPDIQRAYDLANLRAGFENDRYALTLFANNIWDERASLYVSRIINLRHHTNRPRTVGVNARVTF